MHKMRFGSCTINLNQCQKCIYRLKISNYYHPKLSGNWFQKKCNKNK